MKIYFKKSCACFSRQPKKENRLTAANYCFSAGSDLSGITSGSGNKYKEQFKYDANGNLLNLERYDQSPTVMDNFTYNYYGMSNRLNWVDDAAGAGVSSTDMDDQNSGNYSYDAIGQLTADVTEGLQNISWNVRNKVTQVDKAGINDVDFGYDEFGQRVMKRSRINNESNWKETWYVRDAQGNVLGVYEHGYLNKEGGSYTEYLSLAEHHLYGSARLGIKQYQSYNLYEHKFNYSSAFMADGTFNKTEITGDTYPTLSWTSYKINKRELGNKNYELSNHLGNVMEVVTDYKKPVPAAACSTGMEVAVDHYESDVIAFTDYYPFGSVLGGRNGNMSVYRYSFQNQETDAEVKGAGNSVNFEYRMHDPRLGRFLSIDPLAPKYPHNSPYAFSENKLINCIELEGLESFELSGPNGSTRTYGSYEEAISSVGEGTPAGYAINMAQDAYINKVSELKLAEDWETGFEKIQISYNEQTNEVNAAYNGGSMAKQGQSLYSIALPKSLEYGNFYTDGPIDWFFGKGTGSNLDNHYRKFENGSKLALGVFTFWCSWAYTATAGASSLFKVGFANASTDLATQKLFNSWGDVNWTSVGASLFFKSPFASSFVGSTFEFSLNKYFDNSYFLGKKTFGRMFTETLIGTGTGMYARSMEMRLGFSPSSKASKFGLEFGVNFAPTLLNNGINNSLKFR